MASSSHASWTFLEGQPVKFCSMIQKNFTGKNIGLMYRTTNWTMVECCSVQCHREMRLPKAWGRELLCNCCVMEGTLRMKICLDCVLVHLHELVRVLPEYTSLFEHLVNTSLTASQYDLLAIILSPPHYRSGEFNQCCFSTDRDQLMSSLRLGQRFATCWVPKTNR